MDKIVEDFINDHSKCWGEFDDGSLCVYRNCCALFHNRTNTSIRGTIMTPRRPPFKEKTPCLYFVKNK